MSQINQVAHGGRLDEAVARFGGDKSTWLDLSTGINGAGWPVPPVDPEVWVRLPDAAAYGRAETAVRNSYDVPEEAGVCLAPGSQSLIQVLPYLYKPQAVAVVGFTYQEHAACWQRAGHEVYVTDGLESAEATARIIIVVNPNNPDGYIHDPDTLIELSRRLGAKGGLLIVDEAFADVTPQCSVSDTTGRDGLLVLRSLGKYYGLAGVRFGAALTVPTLAQRLTERLGDWALSGPALVVAEAALNDRRWQTKALKRLAAARAQFEDVLKTNNYSIVGGTDLFILVSVKDAAQLAHDLAEHQILVRIFSAKPDWVRFGIPTSKRALNRVGKILRKFAQ